MAEKDQVVGLRELLAMKKIPDKHAFPLKLYVGDMDERPMPEWMELYKEFLSKPTGMSREDWHALYSQNQ